MAEESNEGPLVLIAIDGSEHSHHAFDWYCSFFHQPNHRILLVHSAEYPHIATGQAMYVSGNLWDQMMAKERERVKELEDKYSDLMRSHGYSGKIKAIFGNRPGEVIVDIANEDKASVIIMGTRGHNKLRRTLLGSVSDYVLHHAHCPVLICRK